MKKISDTVFDKLDNLRDYLKSYVFTTNKEWHSILDSLYEIEDSLDIGVCDVCGSYCKKEDMVRARYDYDKDICPDCRVDGN